MSSIIHYLVVFLISMVPLVEIRFAIPYAVGIIKSGIELNIEEMPKMETEEIEEPVEEKENSFKKFLKQEAQKEIED